MKQNQKQKQYAFVDPPTIAQPQGLSSSSDKRYPAGTYFCPECMSVVIKWRTPISDWTRNCPKCKDVKMVRKEDQKTTTGLPVNILYGKSKTSAYGMSLKTAAKLGALGTAFGGGIAAKIGVNKLKKKRQAKKAVTLAGVRDGTGPVAGSAQKNIFGIGKRQQAGETCPVTKYAKDRESTPRSKTARVIEGVSGVGLIAAARRNGYGVLRSEAHV